MELLLPDQDVELWEYAVLVTNSGYALESMAQLYRDQAIADTSSAKPAGNIAHKK
jgi:hypothetical protein